MTPSSAKAKGRNLCKKVKSIILEWLHLSEKDIEVTSSGAGGIDLKLSAEARKQFPYGIECKNQESISIWAAWEQCKINANTEELIPLLIIKRNNSEILAVLNITEFMSLAYEKNKTNKEAQKHDS